MPLDLNAYGIATSNPAAWRGRPLTARGRWDTRLSVLLDNQVAASQAGYLVFTPLALDGCDCAVLVNRGWIALGADRQAVPAVTPIATAVTLHGSAAPPPSPGVGIDTEYADWLAPGLLRVQRVDLAALSRRLGTRLLPLTVRLDRDAADGYLRDWTAPPNRADRHTAYAVQWFALGTLVLVVWVAVALKRRKKKPSSA